MENLAIHIEYLLRHHQCVVVPGVGAFMADWRSARYDEVSGRFMPPQRVVTFNAAIRHDDGVLVSSVGRRRRVGFAEARDIVGRSVNSILRILESGEEMAFGNVGRLRRESSEGRLIFMPRIDAELSMAISGRMPLDMRRHAADRDLSVAAGAPAVEAPSAPQSRKFSDKNYYIAINKRLAHTAAAVVVAASLVLAIFLPTYRGVHPPVEASVVPVSRMIESIQGKSASEVTDFSEKSKRSTQPEQSDQRSQSYQSSAANQRSQAGSIQAGSAAQIADELYYLIVATFHSAEDAQKYVAASSASHPLQIVKSGKTWRISAASSADKDSLISRLNDPRMQSSYPGLWIWKGRPE